MFRENMPPAPLELACAKAARSFKLDTGCLSKYFLLAADLRLFRRITHTAPSSDRKRWVSKSCLMMAVVCLCVCVCVAGGGGEGEGLSRGGRAWYKPPYFQAPEGGMSDFTIQRAPNPIAVQLYVKLSQNE